MNGVDDGCNMTDSDRIAAIEARLAAAEGRPASGGVAGPLTGPAPLPFFRPAPWWPYVGPWVEATRGPEVPC